MRISDWSSDVCSSDLQAQAPRNGELWLIGRRHVRSNNSWMHNAQRLVKGKPRHQLFMHPDDLAVRGVVDGQIVRVTSRVGHVDVEVQATHDIMRGVVSLPHRSEEHTSELQSLMRISYAVFCLKQKIAYNTVVC